MIQRKQPLSCKFMGKSNKYLRVETRASIIVCRNYLHYIKKYQRYKKRYSNIPAHVSPCFRVKEGDHVIIGQCRPILKTVRFNVLKVIPAGAAAGGKKAFAGI